MDFPPGPNAVVSTAPAGDASHRPASTEFVTTATAALAVAMSNGLSHGLLVTNNAATPSTKADISAGYSLLTTTAGTPKFVTSVSVTVDLTTTGANGMDTGSRPTSGWVYLYIINNGSITAGLATTTSPTVGLPSFPSGYSNFNYTGAMYCDGSQNLLRTTQRGRRAQYTVTAATNTAAMPVMGNSSTGSVTVPTWTAVATAAFVPLTAGEIIISLNNTATGGLAIAAPNNAYGALGSTTNPPPVSAVVASGTSPLPIIQATFVLETSNIYWANSASGISLWCGGWTDYWVGA